MATSRSLFSTPKSDSDQSQLGIFSLVGAFDYFDPVNGILPECTFNHAVNNKLTKLREIVADARKILASRSGKQIVNQAEKIQSHIGQNSPYFLRYMRFNQLLDESSPAKALLFCIDDLIEQPSADRIESWSKADCFSVLALSLIANMYANFWKSINEFGINSNSDWNFRHYEWFIQFDHLAKEAIDQASNELIDKQDEQPTVHSETNKVVRPDHIIARYIDYMLAEHTKLTAEGTRFVFKAATNQFIDSYLNNEEIYMMGSEKCLNSLLKYWRDYRKTNADWQQQ